MRKIIISTICMILLLVIIQSAGADLCTLRGYITYKEGEPVEDNTKVLIEYEYYDFTYETYTGNNWPYQNYYFYIFTCRQNKDDVILKVLGETESVWLDRGVIEHNFTLVQTFPEEPPIIEEKPSETDDGGGGSGGGSGGDSSESTSSLPIIKRQLEEGDEIIIMYQEDWIDLSRYILKAKKITEDAIEITLIPGDREIYLLKDAGIDVDLDLDGAPDITITLDYIEGKIAYVSIEKIIKIPGPAVEEPSEIVTNLSRDTSGETQPITQEHVDDSASSISMFNIILILMTALFTLILIFQIKRRKVRNDDT